MVTNNQLSKHDTFSYVNVNSGPEFTQLEINVSCLLGTEIFVSPRRQLVNNLLNTDLNEKVE